MSELSDWAKKKIGEGFTEAQIRDYMIQKGYDAPAVDDILAEARKDAPASVSSQVSWKALLMIFGVVILLGLVALGLLAEIKQHLVSGFVRSLF